MPPSRTAKPVASRVPPTSLVVLPSDHMSPDGDQEYFAHGMSEELINALTRIPDLHVKGRTTGVVVQAMGLDIPQIGEQVGVGAVIEGSIRKSGNSLRVTVQLIAVDDGFHLWSETFERPLGDVFSIQDDIAGAIAEALTVRLASTTAARPAEPGAYELSLVGFRFAHRYNHTNRHTTSG